MANVTLNVTDAKGQATGTVEAPAELFGISNEEIMAHVPLVHQVVVAQLAAARRLGKFHSPQPHRNPRGVWRESARRGSPAPADLHAGQPLRRLKPVHHL